MSTNTWIGVAWCSLIIGAAIWQYFLKFNSQCKKAERQIKEILDLISSFTEQSATSKFEEINKKLASDDCFVKGPWSAYRKTLLKRYDSGGNASVFSTVDSSMYFNEATMLSNLDQDSYSAVPGYLTGGGILGTFLGLTFGISKLEMGNAEAMIPGITGLLGGLGTAFSTSILGIVCATIFSYSYKKKIFKLKRLVEQFQDVLNSKFIFMTSEYLLSDIKTQLEQQNNQMKKFNEEVAINIGCTIEEKLTENLQPTLAELLRAIQDLNASGSAAISESLNEQVGEQLGSFSETLKNAGESLKNNSDMTKELITKMNEQFVSSTDKVAKMLEDASHKQDASADEMARNTQEMLSSMKGSMEMMQSAFHDGSSNLTAELSKNFTEAVSSMQAQLEGVTEKFERLQDASATNMTQTFASISSGLNVLADNLKQQNLEQSRSFSSLTSDLTVKLNDMADKFTEMNSSSTAQIESSLSQLDDLSESMHLMLKDAKAAAAQFKAAAEPVNNSAMQLQNGIELFKRSQENLMAQFNAAMTKINENHAAYGQNFAQLNSLFAEIKNTVGTYNSSIKGTSTELDAVFTRLTDKVREYNVIVGENLNKYLNSYDSHVSSAVGMLESAVSDMKDAVDDLSDTVGKLNRPGR